MEHQPLDEMGTINILLDTDMGNDIDDALALVMLHALESLGECHLLGIAVSKASPWAALYTQLVNTYCGRADLPVSLVSEGVTPEEGSFIRQVCEQAGLGLESNRVERDAVACMRRLLAGERDGAVTIVSIGFYTNLSRLLASAPDEFSPLDGRELIRRKVREVVSMAGDYSAACGDASELPSDNPEYNIRMDIPAARHFIAECPRSITFCGFEVGGAVLFPGSSIMRMLERDAANPVAQGYQRYMPMPYDRPVWDQATVLQAVRPGGGYFDLSGPGRVDVDERGYSVFRPIASGTHRHLILREAQKKRVGDAINRLCQGR